MPRPKKAIALEVDLGRLPRLSRSELCAAWHDHYGGQPPAKMSRDLLSCAIAYKMQEKVHGRLPATMRSYMREMTNGGRKHPPAPTLKPGTVLIREWHGATHEVMVLQKGFLYRDQPYRSLTCLAKVISGVHRSGPEFFGVRPNVRS